MKHTILLTLWTLASVSLIQAATISLSSSAPTVNGADIALLTGTTGMTGDTGDVWGNRPAMGQSFTTGSNATGYSLTSFSFQSDSVSGSDTRAADQDYTIRFGTFSGTTFTPATTEIGISPSGSFTVGDWWTMEFTTAISLAPNTQYAVDILHENDPTFWGWRTVGTTSSEYAGGSAYSSGTNGMPVDDSNLTVHSVDRNFHLDLAANPIPEPSSTLFIALGGLAFLNRRSR